MNDEEWVVASTASGTANASIIKGRLETEGIPVQLKYEAAGVIYAITIDGLGEVKILVPAAHLEAAREVLSRTYKDQELSWDKD